MVCVCEWVDHDLKELKLCTFRVVGSVACSGTVVY